MPRNYYRDFRHFRIMLTTNFITNRLSEVAHERNVTIRYANESGSRGWGLASTDSDYDVRFVYQHPKEWYLRLDRPKDMIGPIMELDGELDLVGWDLRKVLSHIAGSNAGVIEWLYSPVVYHLEEDFLARLRALATSYFQPAKMAAHYLGIAHSARMAGYNLVEEDWNLKKYFYYLRPLLAAEFVLTKRRMAPIVFMEMVEELHHSEVRSVIKELIVRKQEVKEDYRMPIPRIMDDYFDALRSLLKDQLSTTPRRTTDRTEADALFRELVGY
jgi:predicted nucleotidyltransferase